MQFTGGAQTREQTAARLQSMLTRSGQNGFGLYATVLTSTDELIGRCGFIPWQIEGRDEIEVAWLLARAHWGRGLATEAASALVRHGFATLRFTRLISLIHPANTASLNVARKIGMPFEREVVVMDTRVRLFGLTPGPVG